MPQLGFEPKLFLIKASAVFWRIGVAGYSESTPHAEQPEHQEHAEPKVAETDNGVSIVSAVALLGLGAMVESEMLAGMAIGAGLVLAARAASRLTAEVVRPLAKSALKAGYAAVSKLSEIAAEAEEEVQDLIAELRSEYEGEKPQPPTID